MMHFDTRLLHGKSVTAGPAGETVPPVSQTTAFCYKSMEDLAQVFAHRAAGFAYTRIGNPTVAALEQRICELEGGRSAVCFSSGMAAVSAALLSVLGPGDEVIVPPGLYGGSINLLRDLHNLGIRIVTVPHADGPGIRSAIGPHTKLVFSELISNPALSVLDVQEAAEAAHEAGIPLFVDSTTATPYLARPLELGADAVIHSTSKYLNGSGNAIGGIIVDGGRFSWNPARFPLMAPFSKYGRLAFMVRLRTDIAENLGGCMAPFNAFMTLCGLETLGLRMRRICDNAAALAEALAAFSEIKVSYLTLPDHPCHKSAVSLLRGRGGGLLTFRAGSRDRAFRIINSLKYALIASNIGDLRTLVIHPASTLFMHSPQAEREAAGVFDDTVRVSVGIEDPEDLTADFTQAVQAAGKDDIRER